MTAPCFVSAAALTSTFTPNLPATHTRPTSSIPTRRAPRAELLPYPGIPSGQDALENAPLRSYVPRPPEDYSDRGFATILPRTWEGETDTIGADDVPPLTKEGIEEARFVQVDSESSSAFVAFSAMVKAEREQELAELIARNQAEQSGRATCGTDEGKAYVSNYRTVLVDGVKNVEYWGVPNGPVPRLFGGPTA